MKKSIISAVTMLFFAITANAQLAVNYDNKVRIGTETEFLNPLLMVGDDSHFEDTTISVGTAVSTEAQNKRNIAVYSSFFLNGYPSISNDNNFGVLGVVKNLGNTHGRYYGLCGITEKQGVANYHGGTGIFGADNGFALTYPNNISGEYAGYFVGHVRVTNSLTAMSLFTPTDSRLCSSMTSMSERKESGKETLENLLKINVVEYNLKSRLDSYIPNDIDSEKAEELKEEIMFLKKEDQQLTARRHIGIVGQELQKIYPNVVYEGQDGYLSVNYLEMVPLLIRSIQELKQEMDELKEQ